MTEQGLRDKFEGNISLRARAKNSKGKYINSLAQAQWMGFNWGYKMKDLTCFNCDIINTVHQITDGFECGECHEVNPPIDIDTLYSDYIHLKKDYEEPADRLRSRDHTTIS